MSDIWGKRIRLCIFGQSHGPAIGGVIDGLPPGLELDFDQISFDMERRRPGRSPISTSRSETDEAEILSGLRDGKTSGDSLAFIIRNENTRSGDYNSILRPGHADYAARRRYGGHADLRGGGHFSGRLTAPLVFAGSIARQILARRGIEIFGRITQIAGVCDTSSPGEADFRRVREKRLPVCDDAAEKRMETCILEAKSAGDSVGGVIEVGAFGIPAGLGNPFFDSVESVAAGLFFSIPAVKAVEFGEGTGFASMRGSEANDGYCVKDGEISPGSNHNGGILGGITNGMPVIARLTIKPTPSIALPQKSVNPDTGEECTLEIRGRHDPCIAPRAVPVAEAALALALLECIPAEEAI